MQLTTPVPGNMYITEPTLPSMKGYSPKTVFAISKLALGPIASVASLIY